MGCLVIGATITGGIGMKKTLEKQLLRLNTETIRALTQTQLADVEGGTLTTGCSNNTCGGMTKGVCCRTF